MQVRNNKLIYQDKPRLKTALEMLRTSMNLEDSLHEVDLLLIPFTPNKNYLTKKTRQCRVFDHLIFFFFFGR